MYVSFNETAVVLLESGVFPLLGRYAA